MMILVFMYGKPCGVCVCGLLTDGRRQDPTYQRTIVIESVGSVVSSWFSNY